MKQNFTWLLFLGCLFFGIHGNGQGIGLNPTGTSPDPKAIMDMVSSTQGFLIPRMTQVQRMAISSPASGLLVYQNDGAKGFYHFTGSVWVPWLKPRSGTVSMGLASSTVLKGTGYSVNHIEEGRDQVLFSEPFLTIPDITLSAEGIAGAAPRAPFDYCFNSLTDCSNVHNRFIRLKTAIGVTPDATVFFESGVTACNPVSNNYTSYNLSQPFYTSQPLNINASPLNAGSSFYMYAARSSTASATNANIYTLWFDWDQSGDFDDNGANNFAPLGIERMLVESGSSTTTPLSNIGATNYLVTIPPAAQVCNGVITARLQVRDANNNAIPCDIPGLKGETEDFEINVQGGTNCSSTYKPKSVSCNILNPSTSGFFVNCVDALGESINGTYNFKVVQ